MSEILQSEEIKLYEYDQHKPDLSDVIEHCKIVDQDLSDSKTYLSHYNHNHDPRNGQFTTSGGSGYVKKSRSDKGGVFKKKSKKNRVEIKKSNEQAIADRDLKYIQSHVDDFSTKEINDLLNRINTEARLDAEINKSASTKKQVKKILSSPAFKLTAALTLAGLSYATYQAYEGATATTPRLTDKSNPYSKQFVKDIGTGIGKGVGRKIKKTAGIKN